MPTLDCTLDISCPTPFDLTTWKKTGGAEEGVGTRARNLEQIQEHLLVVDQAGEYKQTPGTCAQSEQYLSSSPREQRKKTEDSRLTRNVEDWTNKKPMDEYDGTNYYSTRWQRIEENSPRRTEHNIRKNNNNKDRRVEEAKPTPNKRTLLIENMTKFRSYDWIEDIACKGCKAEQIKQTIQEKEKVKCYIAYETYQDAITALNQEKTIKEELGSQISLRMVNETEWMKAFAGREPYIVNKQQKEIEKTRNRRSKLKKETIPKFFWARFKPNTRKRFLEANKWLYSKIGQPNWKKYNSGILIEAGIDQSYIIKQMTPETIVNSPFSIIEPHNKFNTT